jgi:hypothetical protein
MWRRILIVGGVCFISVLLSSTGTSVAQDEAGRWSVVDTKQGVIRVDAKTGESQLLVDVNKAKPRWQTILTEDNRQLRYIGGVASAGELPNFRYLGPIPDELPKDSVGDDSVSYLTVKGNKSFSEMWDLGEPVSAASKGQKFKSGALAIAQFHWHEVHWAAIAQTEEDARGAGRAAIAALDQEDVQEVVDAGTPEDELLKLLQWDLDWQGEKGEKIELSTVWAMRISVHKRATIEQIKDKFGDPAWVTYLYLIYEVQAVANVRTIK